MARSAVAHRRSAIRRSSSSRRWSRRASRASSSRSAIDRRCRARCPAKATGSSSKSSWRPARAAASRRGGSTSAVRAATTSAASRGASSSQDRLASIEGLHRLALHPEKQFAAKNLVLKAIDFELRLPSGDVFVAETPEGVTAIVLRRRRHAWSSSRRRRKRSGQLKLFAGVEALETPFTSAFVRLNPFEFEQRVVGDMLEPVALDSRALSPRPGRVRRGRAEVVQPRPERPEPRHVVAAAAAGRLRRRGARRAASTT